MEPVMARLFLRRWLSRGERGWQTTRPDRSRKWKYGLSLELLEGRIAPAGPRVINVTPTEVQNLPFDHLDVQFNVPINSASVGTDDLTITGPSGLTAPTGVIPLAPDAVRFTFPALPERGNYQAVLGPNIADLAGNLMDQNQNGVN